MTDSDPSDRPTTHNEFVKFIRRNDESVIARELSENYIPIEALQELIEEWHSEAIEYHNDGKHEAYNVSERRKAQLQAVIDEHE